MGHRPRGWLYGAPFLNNEDRLAESHGIPMSRRFRFPAEQSDKVADCDDFRQSHVNRFRRNATPISLPFWGIIAFRAKQTLSDKGERPFVQTDRSSAYKNLSIRVSDIIFARVALRRPISAR